MGIAHTGTGSFGPADMGFGSASQGLHAESSESGDALDVYFQCITTCSLDDGACVTHCVEQLREQP